MKVCPSELISRVAGLASVPGLEDQAMGPMMFWSPMMRLAVPPPHDSKERPRRRPEVPRELETKEVERGLRTQEPIISSSGTVVRKVTLRVDLGRFAFSGSGLLSLK